MRSLFSVLALIVSLSLSGSARAAWVSDTVIQTVSNSHGPEGREIEIKNVDLHHLAYGNQGFSGVSHYLAAYLWLKADLGYETAAIDLVDVNDFSRKPTVSSGMTARRVGFDAPTGATVYEVRLEFGRETPAASARLYGSVTLDGRTYYTNEGSPESYFEFNSARGE